MRAKSGILVFSFLLVLVAVPAFPVTTTDLNSITPQQLAQLLAGPGVTVSNVTFTGANVAGGSFTGGLADGIGIDSGVILTSGNVANAAGPNDDDGVSTINETPGDADLNAIVGVKHQTFDAAVLEFDFVPSSSTVSFRYVFASDEYNEFVGFFNDVFAFFIDGQNVALIPGTTTPVAINTVNLDTNPSFYKNNDPSDLGIPTPFATQFDGFTTVLTATATLTPNTTHHIKLAIADTDDARLDSAVFLQAASFVSQTLTVSKSAPTSVASGSDFTYTITYGNAGNTAASNVVITDPLPQGVTFVSATGGGQLTEGGLVSWEVGTVGAGVTGQTVSFTVHVTATSGNITNSNYTIQGTGISQVTGTPVSTAVTGGGGGCPTITLSPASLPAGTVGVSYNQSITASGGEAPFFFSVLSGTPPPGLELSSTGVLSGTPTADGTFSFTVRAIDANECSGTRSYTVTIGSSGGCAVTLSPLFDAFVGVPYQRMIQANGASPPVSFSVTSGSLPSGLSLSSSGVVSGTPTAGGAFTFRVRAVDSNQCVASRTYTLTVSCPFATISPSLLPSASQGVAYAQTLTVLQSGTRTYTFAVTAGSLPPGLTLSPSGDLSGSPTQTGSFSFTVTATDPNGCTASRAYTLAVCTALTLAPEALPSGTAGAPYSATIVATGGAAPYTFAQVGLPSGITLNPTTGVLSGTTVVVGFFDVTVTVVDANGCPGTRTYPLTICPPLALSPASLPSGAVGVSYSATFVASGAGAEPYTYTASGLPAGLVLSTGGALSGAPVASGTLAFTVTATDVIGCAVSRAYTLTVTDAPPMIVDLTLQPAGADFVLSIAGSGFAPGAVVIINGVSYPATFVSATLLTVNLPASAVPATGSINVEVRNPGPTGGTSNPESLTFCSPPGAPLNPTIVPFGNPTGPVTATDFLVVSWDPPASGPAPSSYEFRINGDPYTVVVGATSAIVPPRGSNDPITLHVRAHCNADVAGPETSSVTYSLAPPVADFTFSAARAGSLVQFTDTSSPQATSWFWIFDDGATSTLQSPTHTFTTAGTHRVALIATNGSGSSQAIKDVVVSPATASGGAATSSARSFAATAAGRWRLTGVRISAGRPAWLEVRSPGAEEAIVYLRFLDANGTVALERRLSVSPGETATNDAGAYGLYGTFTLELVAGHPIDAVLAEPAKTWTGLGLARSAGEEAPR